MITDKHVVNMYIKFVTRTLKHFAKDLQIGKSLQLIREGILGCILL